VTTLAMIVSPNRSKTSWEPSPPHCIAHPQQISQMFAPSGRHANSCHPRPGRRHSRGRTSWARAAVLAQSLVRLASESKCLTQMNKSSDRSKVTKKHQVNSQKKEVSPCCRGRIFIEGLLTRLRCARRKWRTRPKRTNLKRLRRNGQHWRNG